MYDDEMHFCAVPPNYLVATRLAKDQKDGR